MRKLYVDIRNLGDGLTAEAVTGTHAKDLRPSPSME